MGDDSDGRRHPANPPAGDHALRLAILASLVAVIAALLQMGWFFGGALAGGLLFAAALAGWRRRVLLLAGVLLAGSVVARPAIAQATPTAVQKPARDVRTSGTGSGVIRGRIVAAGSGVPLRRARVVLSAVALPRPRVTSSDDEGRFEFLALAPDRYTLSASKTGCVPLQFGQRHAFEPGTPVDLAEGQTLEGLTIALPAGGVIAGRITDETGEPIAAVFVAATRRRYQDGERRLVPIGRAVETDDRGEFRLFDLAPASYVIGTTWRPDGEMLPYGTAYHPGTANPAEAQAVPVKTGETVNGVDIVLPVTRLARLSGTVVGGRGEPITGIRVVANAGPGDSFISYRGIVAPDGSFTIPSLPPGDYDVNATAEDHATGTARRGNLRVQVAGVDLTGLLVTVVPGSRVTGRIVFDGDAAPPFAPGAIAVWAEPVRGRVSGPVGTIKGDWTFELTGLAGDRLIRVSRLSPGWTLKSVELAGHDITDTPIELSGIDDVTGIRLVLTNRVTTLEGRVRDAHGNAGSAASVLVFPDDRGRWGDRSRFVMTTRPDTRGAYRLVGLPPGAYLAVALDYLEDGAAGDPDVLEFLRDRAVALTLAEGETATLDLTVLEVGR